MKRGIVVVGIILLTMAFVYTLNFVSAAEEEVYLTSAMHLDTNRTEVFDFDGNFYLADMKDSSKNFYLNFSDNLINNSILSLYAKKNKGVAIGVYSQLDDSGTYPIALFTVTSTIGEWFNLTLDINESTNAVWIGEGAGSGTDSKDEFDYITAFNPILDASPPNLTIDSPLNQSYNINQLDLNFSVDDENLDSCWYSDDDGLTNTSLVDCTNSTYSASQGSTTIRIWANDSLGNLNDTEFVTFYVDSIAPSVNIILPQDGDSYGYNTAIALNFTADDANLDSCWYSLDYGANISLTGCGNISFSVVGSGSYMLELFVNDSFSLKSMDFASFSVNVGAPTISLSSPIDVYLNDTNVTFVYTPSDVDLDSCELWGNFSEEFILNQTDADVVSDIENYFYLDLSDGNYSWNIRCNDTLNNVADNGNKSFIVDTTIPVITLTQPSGSKTSRSISATWSVSEVNLDFCWYNVYRGENIEITNTSVTCTDNNASFTVTLDADFVFNFYANDSAGNNAEASSSFSVSTSSPPPSGGGTGGGGGGGGGGGYTPQVEEEEKAELSVSGVADLVMEPGESETISVSVRNNGDVYLNKCKLTGGGEASSWISEASIGGIAAGQEVEVVFVVSAPNDASGEVGATVFIACDEARESEHFIISILGTGLQQEIRNIEQVGKRLDFTYFVENTGEENLEVKVEYWLVDSDGRKDVAGEDSFVLASRENVEKQASLDLSGLVAGSYTLVIKISSEKGSTTLQEQVIISQRGLTGAAIFGAEGGKVISIIIMVGVSVVIAFFIVRNIIKKVGKHDRAHFVRHKLKKHR